MPKASRAIARPFLFSARCLPIVTETLQGSRRIERAGKPALGALRQWEGPFQLPLSGPSSPLFTTSRKSQDLTLSQLHRQAIARVQPTLLLEDDSPLIILRPGNSGQDRQFVGAKQHLLARCRKAAPDQFRAVGTNVLDQHGLRSVKGDGRSEYADLPSSGPAATGRAINSLAETQHASSLT